MILNSLTALEICVEVDARRAILLPILGRQSRIENNSLFRAVTPGANDLCHRAATTKEQPR